MRLAEDAWLLEQQSGVMPRELGRGPKERLLSGRKPFADRTGLLRCEPTLERLGTGAAPIRITEDPLEQNRDTEVAMHRRTSRNERPGMLPAKAAGSRQPVSGHWIVDLLPEEGLQAAALLLGEQAAERTAGLRKRLADSRCKVAIERDPLTTGKELAEPLDERAVFGCPHHGAPPDGKSLCRPDNWSDRGYQPQSGSSAARRHPASLIAVQFQCSMRNLLVKREEKEGERRRIVLTATRARAA